MTEIILTQKSMDEFLNAAQQQLETGHTQWHDYVGSVKFTAPSVDASAPYSPQYAQNQLDI